MNVDRRTLCFALFGLGVATACAWALHALQALQASMGA